MKKLKECLNSLRKNNLRRCINIILLIQCFSICNAQDTIIGELVEHKVIEKETFYDIARDHDVGIDELTQANPGVDPWTPSEDLILIIPSMHILPSPPYKGVIINRAELRLYYFPVEGDIKSALTFPLGLGALEHSTPLGVGYITQKIRHPFWTPPTSIRKEDSTLPNFVIPGEDNPLGDYAIFLTWKEILIHGSNKPWGIGAYSSHGCIRMHEKDISSLFNKVKVGTQVRIIDEPIKWGWLKGNLYLEVSPSDLEVNKASLMANFMAESNNIDEALVDIALQERKSIPIKISK
jgi:L,D-transpeptidase ErfK/SrfK